MDTGKAGQEDQTPSADDFMEAMEDGQEQG